MKRTRWILALALLVFIIDQLAKAYTHANIPMMSPINSIYPYGGIAIFHNFFGIDFSINHAINKGAAWGMLSSFQHVLLIARIIVILGLVGYLVLFNKHPSRTLPLTIVATAAFSNVLDYFVYGHVVDMFHFKFWNYSFPIFNVADSAIFCAVASLLLQSWTAKLKTLRQGQTTQG